MLQSTPGRAEPPLTSSMLLTESSQPRMHEDARGPAVSRHCVCPRWAVKNFLLIAGFTVYCIIGGWIFRRIEEPAQLDKWVRQDASTRAARAEVSRAIINAVAENCSAAAATDNKTECLQVIDDLLLDFGDHLLEKERADRERYRWNVNNGIWYAITLITTIGYGHVACETFWGRLVTIVYAFIGIPYTLIVLANMGDTLATAALYAWNRHLKATALALTGCRVDGKSTTSVPILFATCLVFVYMLVCAAVVRRGESWDYFTAFYFTFISQTTIGLGDVMPMDWFNSFSVPFVMLLGLALVSMCYQVVQRNWTDAYDAVVSVVVPQTAFVDTAKSA